jgi:AcrR family transcriptional regulator
MTPAADVRPTRTGRRPGASDTRERILAAARAAFGELGFEAATIRGMAARAGVDPALVHHYFGTKQQLFVAAMEIPVDTAAVIPEALAGPPGELGERIARLFLELWDSPSMHPLMLGIVRSATTDPVAAAMFRRVLAEGPFLALARAANRPHSDLRATLVGTQLVGLALARYVVKIEPIASTEREVLARAIGPTLQRYLAGDLGEVLDTDAGGAAPRP